MPTAAVEVHEVDPAHPGPLPQRASMPAEAPFDRYGGHQEQQVGVDQLAQQVADVTSSRWMSSTNSTSGPRPTLVGQHGPHLGHDRHQVDPLGADAGREQGQRPEQCRRRPPLAVAQATITAVPVGEGETLVGQAGLATPGAPWITEPWKLARRRGCP